MYGTVKKQSMVERCGNQSNQDIRADSRGHDRSERTDRVCGLEGGRIGSSHGKRGIAFDEPGRASGSGR